MNSQASDRECIDMQNIDRLNRNSENAYKTIHYYAISGEVKLETSENTVKSNSPKSDRLTKVLKICVIVFMIVVLAILVYLVAFNRVPKESPLLKDLIQETANNVSTFKSSTESIKIKDTLEFSNPVINKITKALTADFKFRFGRQILHKSGQCLDSTFHIWNEMYLLTPATCISDSPTQQFRLTPQNTIEVASGEFLSKIQNGKQPCLEIYEQSSSGAILAYPCHGGGQQHFFLRIYPRQIDLPNGRIYFSIHSFMYPSRCFTMYRHPSNHSAFHLDECWGSDKQSFYLVDVNFNQEIVLMLSKTE